MLTNSPYQGRNPRLVSEFVGYGSEWVGWNADPGGVSEIGVASYLGVGAVLPRLAAMGLADERYDGAVWTCKSTLLGVACRIVRDDALLNACGYLVLHDVRVSSDREDDVESLHEPDDGDDGEDHATMYVDSLGVHEQHLYTYHVVYNESYRVPMLFLRGRLQDGRPLQWNSVLRDLPVGSQHVINQSRWTFLTQEDHPLLHRPWFALHPCGTSEIMRLVFSDLVVERKKVVSEQLEEPSCVSAASEEQATCESLLGIAEIATSDRSVKWDNSEARFASWIENYILTWMSFACPAVGLAIPSRLYVESNGST